MVWREVCGSRQGVEGGVREETGCGGGVWEETGHGGR